MTETDKSDDKNHKDNSGLIPDNDISVAEEKNPPEDTTVTDNSPVTNNPVSEGTAEPDKSVQDDLSGS